MAQTDKPKIEELTEELDFWNTYREVQSSKGINVALLHADLAKSVEQEFRSPGAREDFASLRAAGCLPEGLALLVLLLRYSPFFEQSWTQMVGESKSRKTAARALENAATTLETLFAGVIEAGDDAENRFTKVGRLPVSSLISELRLYGRVINLAQLLSKDSETRSLAELFRYVLTGYVKRMTGRFHDNAVSGLLSEIFGIPGYNEGAQNMWRKRNYKRLELHI